MWKVRAKFSSCFLSFVRLAGTRSTAESCQWEALHITTVWHKPGGISFLFHMMNCSFVNEHLEPKYESWLWLHSSVQKTLVDSNSLQTWKIIQCLLTVRTQFTELHRITGEIEAYPNVETKANESQIVQLHFVLRSEIWSSTNMRPPRSKRNFFFK